MIRIFNFIIARFVVPITRLIVPKYKTLRALSKHHQLVGGGEEGLVGLLSGRKGGMRAKLQPQVLETAVKQKPNIIEILWRHTKYHW